MNILDDRCETCRKSRPFNDDSAFWEQGEYLQCRAHPPQLFANSQGQDCSAFPVVNRFSWCAEFEGKNEENASELLNNSKIPEREW